MASRDSEELRRGDLTEDIEDLLGLENKIGEKEFEELFQNSSAGLGDISRIVPVGAIRLTFVILDERRFETLKGDFPDKVEVLEKARDFAQKHTSRLLDFPNLKEQFENALRGESDFNALSEVVNTVNQVICRSAWFFEEEAATPSVRVLLANYKSKKILLDTTVEWGELSFMIERLMKGLMNDVVLANSMLGKENWGEVISQRKTKGIEERIDQIRNHCERVSGIFAGRKTEKKQ